jgi:hypothetical protein
MNNALSVALSKIPAQNGARDALTPGVYPINTMVQLSGQIEVFDDTDRTPTVSIPLNETLALFIAYSGITSTYAIEKLRLAMTHAIGNTGCGKGALEATMPIVVQTMQRVENELLSQLPRTPVKGQVRTNLTVTEVTQVPVGV